MNRSSQLRARRQKFLKMILGCAGVLVLLSTTAIAADPKQEAMAPGPKVDKHPSVDCGTQGSASCSFNSHEKNKDRNEVHQGKKIDWEVHGPIDEVWSVQFEFLKKVGVDCEGVSPLDSSSPFGDKIEDGYVKISKKVKSKEQPEDLCYNYKITCYKPDGSVACTIDPIIDVPKK